MNNPTRIVVTGLIAVALGFGLGQFWQTSGGNHSSDRAEEKKPLYWVAPMDPNFRRDKPGKSPMGMDLIPVYEDNESSMSEPGAVSISPEVINNLSVKTQPVMVGSLQSIINTVGTVRFNENQIVHIHPRVDGWIEKLFVKAAGDPVRKDEPLYTLYSPELVNAQEELLIALRRQNKGLIDAARDRLQALQLTDEFIANLEKNKTIKKHITVYAPQSGFVQYLKIREGYFVNPGNTLLSIGQLENIWIEVDVFERDAAILKTGMLADINSDYFPGLSWQSQVNYIYPSLDTNNRTLRARIVLDNINHQLKPNMFVNVMLSAKHRTQQILVPASAIIRTEQNQRVVVALGNGRFKSVSVKLGQSGYLHSEKVKINSGDESVSMKTNPRYFEILSGLKETDDIVTSAHFLIDSESSKTSDFQRMTQSSNTNLEAESEVQQATVEGRVNSISGDKRQINISRDAIEKWGRPAATIDFLIEEGLDLSKINVGDSVRFTFQVRSDLVIIRIEQVHSNVSDNSNQERNEMEHHEQ